MSNIYDNEFAPNDANHTALTPLHFIERAAKVHPLNLAIEVYCENLPFLEAVVATKTGEVPHADALSYRYE